MSAGDFIILVFCCVEGYHKKVIQYTNIRARGFAPTVCDNEVTMMEVASEIFSL